MYHLKALIYIFVSKPIINNMSPQESALMIKETACQNNKLVLTVDVLLSGGEGTEVNVLQQWKDRLYNLHKDLQ